MLSTAEVRQVLNTIGHYEGVHYLKVLQVVTRRYINIYNYIYTSYIPLSIHYTLLLAGHLKNGRLLPLAACVQRNVARLVQLVQ